MERLTRRDFLVRSGGTGAALVGLPILAACVSQQPSVSASLSVWKAPHSPKDADFFTSRLNDFTKAHSEVKQAAYRVTPWETWDETYTTAFKGDSPPDVSYIIGSWFAKFAKAGQLVDLNSVGGSDLTKWQAIYPTDLWNLAGLNGSQYGLPFLKAGVEFVWNKKLFRDAGLDPETPPATWEQLRKYAQQLTKKVSGGVTQWGYGMTDNTSGEELSFVTIPIANYGGAWTTPDDKRWIANSEGHVAGLQVQVDMMQHDKTMVPFGTFKGHAIWEAFLGGKIAMALTYSSFVLPSLPNYPDFEMGVSSPPAGPAQSWDFGDVGYWMMAAKSKYKSQAWQLMQFLAEKGLTNDYCVATQLDPCRTDIDPFQGKPLNQAFGKAQKNFMRIPRLAFDFWGLLIPETEAALLGQKSAKDALDTAAQRINDRIQTSG